MTKELLNSATDVRRSFSKAPVNPSVMNNMRPAKQMLSSLDFGSIAGSNQPSRRNSYKSRGCGCNDSTKPAYTPPPAISIFNKPPNYLLQPSNAAPGNFESPRPSGGAINVANNIYPQRPNNVPVRTK
jgi:hypothetical protein